MTDWARLLITPQKASPSVKDSEELYKALKWMSGGRGGVFVAHQEWKDVPKVV